MKKRFISFVSAIAVAFVAFAQVSEEAVQFTAVQDDARLVAGKRYIVVAQDGEDWVALSDQYNGTTPYRLPAAITVGEEGIETLVATAAVESENLAVPYVLVLEGSADAWKLYDEANGKYLHWVSKRSMTLDEEGSTWAISIDENGEAVLKLVPLPKVSLSLLVPFKDMKSAIEAVPKIIRSKVTPTAIEYMSRYLLRALT